MTIRGGDHAIMTDDNANTLMGTQNHDLKKMDFHMVFVVLQLTWPLDRQGLGVLQYLGRLAGVEDGQPTKMTAS